MPDLICVNPAIVHEVWPYAKELLLSAIRKGGNLSSFAELEADIRRGGSLLWLVWDAESQVLMAVAATRLDIINGAKVGTVLAAAGKGLDQFGHLLPQLEEHFRVEGCVFSRICGRRGWGRYYRDYRIKAVVLEKPL